MRNGKLTVRERLPLLADPGYFREFGGLRGQVPLRRATGSCRRPRRTARSTACADRRAQGRRDRRRLHRSRRVRRAAARRPREELSASERALEWRLPVRPAARCRRRQRAQLRGRSGARTCPTATASCTPSRAARTPRPVVSAVLGAAAGIGALHTSLAHWNVMVARHPGVPRRAAGGQGRARRRHHQGGARRPAGAHPRRAVSSTTWPTTEAEAIGMIRAVPLLPAVERRRAGAAARAARPGRSATRTRCSPRAEGAEEGARRPPADRAASSTRARSSRSPRATGGPGSPAWPASTATPWGSWPTTPCHLGGRHRRRRRAEGGPPPPAVRHCSTSRSSTSPTSPA